MGNGQSLAVEDNPKDKKISIQRHVELVNGGHPPPTMSR
jgi:hypothetical protein